MKSRTIGLRVAGFVFAVVCLAQLGRLVTRVEILAGGYSMPLWPNALAFVIMGGLSVWMWWLSYRGSP